MPTYKNEKREVVVAEVANRTFAWQPGETRILPYIVDSPDLTTISAEPYPNPLVAQTLPESAGAAEDVTITLDADTKTVRIDNNSAATLTVFRESTDNTPGLVVLPGKVEYLVDLYNRTSKILIQFSAAVTEGQVVVTEYAYWATVPQEGGTGSVIVTDSALPDGAATSANQETQIAAEEALLEVAGATDDAVVDAGAEGTLSAKLRRISTDLDALADAVGDSDDAVVDAGAVGTVASKLRRLSTDIGAILTTAGATDDALVDAGAEGTLSAKLRRLSTDLDTLTDSTGGTDDAVVDAGATGTLSAKLRRISTDLDSVMDTAGAVDDVVVDAGAEGTLSAKLRRISTDIDSVMDAIGATDDAVVDAGAVGTLSSKLRRLSTDLDALMDAVGASDDALVDAGAVGTLSAKIRRVSTDLDTLMDTAGTTADTPAVAVEDATARTLVSLLKGIKNYLHELTHNGATITVASGTKAVAGDNEIIAAPAAGNRIVVSYLMAQLEADSPTTIIWKAGAADAYRLYAPSIGAALVKDFPAGREWRLPDGTALNLNLSAANSTGYTVEYRTEAV